MKKIFITVILVIFMLGFVFSTVVFINQPQEKNLVREIFLNPNNFPRLPDNLESYLCDNGKVDLDLAALDIKKGMNPSTQRIVYKNELNCGGN